MHINPVPVSSLTPVCVNNIVKVQALMFPLVHIIACLYTSDAMFQDPLLVYILYFAGGCHFSSQYPAMYIDSLGQNPEKPCYIAIRYIEAL